MQNPIQEFSPHRPQLPGQTHPGLGVAKNINNMLNYLATKAGNFYFFIN